MRYSVPLFVALALSCWALAQAPAEEQPAENAAAQKATDLAVQRGIDWLTRRQCANCHFSVPDKTGTAAPLAAGELPTVQVSGLLRLIGKRPEICQRNDEKREQVTYLGVSLVPVPGAVRRHVKVPFQMGLLVETVDEGSPAQAAGLARHDILVKIDEQWLVNPEQFSALIRTFQPAAEVKLTAIQKNAAQVLSAKLASREAPAAASSAQQYRWTYLNQLHAAHGGWKEAQLSEDFDRHVGVEAVVASQALARLAAADKPGEPAAAPRKKIVTYLGVHTSSPPEALANQLRLAPGLALLIDAVEENTAAAKAGLKPFDVLQKLDDQLLVNGEQFTALIRAHKPGEEVTLTLIRAGKPQAVRSALGQLETEVAADEPPGDDADRLWRSEFDGNLVSRRILTRWLTDKSASLADAAGSAGGQDAEFIRRSYLDLLGVLPTPAQAKAFIEDTGKNKRKDLIDELLGRPEVISRASGSWAVDWKDGEHRLSLISKDGLRHLTVQRLEDGKSLFDGPVDTDQQQQALPDDVASKLALMFKSQSAGPPQTAKAGELLERVLPSVELNEVPLKRAIEQLRKETGANVAVNWKALKQAGISADEPISLSLRDVRVSTVLSTLLALASDDKARLGYTVDGEVILISVKSK